MKATGPSKSGNGVVFSSVALILITDHIAPFLTKWHEPQKEFEQLRAEGVTEFTPEKSWECRDEFLSDLRELQRTSIQYTAFFAKAAGVVSNDI
ncbi:hypothetical protein SLH49_05290 [Cognatiyoonia sp. IB215446]|uniref:hypothetical protein n=1 Tax=Cognatiyoonia sp. IB215446 TaxID=3097355 RepID=UPI002A184D18|nr:hypothetical protein [Cognatiyoonia sp. IB215446]MDX8347396.1 hypothetical protein [Cognatiyoonia sp. IB215446]